VFQNRVLKMTFWSRTGETNGDGRRLHNADLHELHSSSGLRWVIKPRRTKTGEANETYAWE